MPASSEILRLRVLLYFLNDDSGSCTVTELSRVFSEQKYTISRVLTAMEKDGLMDRSDSRSPKLTDLGIQRAKQYEERVAVILNHLMYEGLDTESAQHDAFYWALYSTDQSMEVIRATEKRYRIKYELRNKKKFSGSVFCKAVREGTYQFPFIIYCEHICDESNISPINEEFEHPCTLRIENGSGTVQLRSANTAVSARTRRSTCRHIYSIMYADGGAFLRAEKNGNIFSFPAASLNFMNISTGAGQILHGSICLKIQYAAETDSISEEKVIFTFLI